MPRKPTRKPFYAEAHSSWAIPLTNGVIALVDQDIAETLGQHNWYAHDAGNICWYARRAGDNKDWNAKILMHKVILPCDPDFDVDHKEYYDLASKLIDNRRSNLRIVTRSKNMQNTLIKSTNTSGYKGVTWDRNRDRWIAGIMHDYKHIFLGRFKDKQEAALAYDQAAIKLFGEHAKTNAQLGLISAATHSHPVANRKLVGS